MSASDSLIFSKARHIKYWLRCLKTHLPTQYTSSDSQRITFAFFTLSALDLLGVLHERTSAAERDDYTEWIYRCQHPDGGFRGFTGADVGEARFDKTLGPWDPANLASTFFALAALTVLGDTLERVKRKKSLLWLENLQLKDGSFGEAVGEGGKIEGGGDIRYCYLAAAVRWMLRGDRETGKGEESIKDIDVPALVGFITSSQVSMGSQTCEGMCADRGEVIRGWHCTGAVPRGPWYAFCRLYYRLNRQCSLWNCSWVDLLWHRCIIAAGKVAVGTR